MASDRESSSSDEENQDFTGHVNIPNINLSQIRGKQSKVNPKDNLLKVGRNFTPRRKKASFPANSRSREPVINEDSTSDSSSEEGTEFEGDTDLPVFRFESAQLQGQSDEDIDDDDEGEYNYVPSQSILDDSSSSEDEEEQKERKKQSPAQSPQASSKTLSPSASRIHSNRSNEVNSRHSRNSIFGFVHGETDITDQKRLSGSGSEFSGSTNHDSNRQGLKGIWRKLSLADQEYSDPRYYHEAEAMGSSKADSFIGRVLNMSNNGLSGGGLTPGASRLSRERPIDEEENVGMEDSNSVEMRKLDFTNTSDEARNLILSHVPDAAALLSRPEFDQNLETVRETPEEGVTAFNVDKEREKSEGTTHLDDHPRASTDHDEEFYQPNPDIDFIAPSNDYTMMLDEDMHDDYVAPPKKFQAGVLSSLLKLYQNPQANKSSASTLSSTYDIDTKYSEERSKISSGFKNLGKGMMKGGHHFKSDHLSGKKQPKEGSSSSLSEYDEKKEGSTPDEDIEVVEGLPSFQKAKPKTPKKASPLNHTINNFNNFNPTKVPQMRKKIRKHRKEQAEQLRITVHIADILQRQKFIMRMCRALMLFGAPTHRLEEYMTMTSRVLEIDGQFMYLPGCMIVSFGDAATRTSEVHLVKCVQGVNLSKLADTHTIYKSVIHDLVGVEEAASKLEDLLRKKNLYSPWICVFLYGLGSASVCPFAFSGDWYDIPISFGIGLCVGYLQFFLSSMSNLYSSVFEVTASIVVSFIARAIGSIRGSSIFCFGAVVQGSLALILPGYIILCGSLELQSKNLVAGSVRMFYAIIYSLFLGFGITLGAALYGWVDKNSTNQAQCAADHKIDDKWRILFVPLYSICLALINQARWRQLPVMVAISGTGYVGTYFAGKHFSTVTEFTACIGAFIIGILGNMYSRIGKGMAVSAMLPAIFVQVPSGIASKSTLLSGISSANEITHSKNSTQSSGSDVDSLSFGATMVEVSIGISVGLFAAALVVYPFGKKRTGLFTL